MQQRLEPSCVLHVAVQYSRMQLCSHSAQPVILQLFVLWSKLQPSVFTPCAQELVPELYLYLADSRWFPDFVASSEPDAPPPGKVLQRPSPSCSVRCLLKLSIFT